MTAHAEKAADRQHGIGTSIRAHEKVVDLTDSLVVVVGNAARAQTRFIGCIISGLSRNEPTNTIDIPNLIKLGKQDTIISAVRSTSHLSRYSLIEISGVRRTWKNGLFIL